jgi:phosphomannomutase
MNFLSSIFKLNDIRGIYPTELNEEVAYRIGRSLVKLLNCKNIAVGRDIRLSSKSLFDGLTKGIIESGCNVINLGLISTDALYYVMGNSSYDCGVMITASHNPPQFNGFKIVKKGGIMLYEDNGLKDLEDLVLNMNLNEKSSTLGQIISLDIKQEFINYLLSFINKEGIKSLYFGIDTSNGMAGLFIRDLLNQLPVRFEIINENLDGSFPNHLPDSFKKESWEQISNLIKNKKLDFGVVFDGDADRISFFDEKGEYIDSSVIAILIINNLLKNNSQKAIIIDSVLSPLIEEKIKQLKGVPIRTKIGHSFMKNSMRENDALFGAEHSGHYYYKKHFYCDSGMITLLMMIQILSKNDKPLSLLKKEINPHVMISEINYLKTEDYKEKLKLIEDYYQSTCLIEHFDGLIITGKGFRIHIHPANTGPFIRINLEAENNKILEEKNNELNNLFSRFNFQLAQ